jgi:hypothetical protein
MCGDGFRKTLAWNMKVYTLFVSNVVDLVIKRNNAENN